MSRNNINFFHWKQTEIRERKEKEKRKKEKQKKKKINKKKKHDFNIEKLQRLHRYRNDNVRDYDDSESSRTVISDADKSMIDVFEDFHWFWWTGCVISSQKEQ